MRDLQVDLEICNAVLPIKPKVPSDFRFMEDALFFVEAREGWPHAIERAINAEAENALLRKVADAARALAPSEMYQYTRHLFNLKHTLDEYDEAKEGQVEMGEYGGPCVYQIPPSKGGENE